MVQVYIFYLDTKIVLSVEKWLQKAFYAAFIRAMFLPSDSLFCPLHQQPPPAAP
jgi:hypothetical protein